MATFYKFFLFYVFFLFLFACQLEKFNFHTPSLVEISPAMLLDYPHVELLSAKGTEEELKKITFAVSTLNEIYRSDCFQREVITRNFSETNGLNNQEIYNVLRSGTIYVNLIMYQGSFIENRVWKTVGFVRGNIPDTIFQNRYFVKDSNSIARNMIHEIAHLRKFNHYTSFSSSVPYQMNEIFDVCLNEL